MYQVAQTSGTVGNCGLVHIFSCLRLRTGFALNSHAFPREPRDNRKITETFYAKSASLAEPLPPVQCSCLPGQIPGPKAQDRFHTFLD